MRTSETPSVRITSRSSVTYALATSGASAPGARDRLGDDLDQRDAGAVVVDERVVGAVDAAGRAAHVGGLAGVLLQVDALDLDPDGLAVHLDVEVAVEAERLVVLARSGSSSACPDRSSSSGRTGTTRRSSSSAPGRSGSSTRSPRVDHRQRTGQRQAHRADLGVRLGAERRRAAAEHLRSRCPARRGSPAPSPARSGSSASSYGMSSRGISHAGSPVLPTLRSASNHTIAVKAGHLRGQRSSDVAGSSNTHPRRHRTSC